MDMGAANFTYVSAGRLDVTLHIPPTAPVGVYAVSILSNGKVLQQQPNVFGIVPPNWLSMVKLAAPLSAGKNGQLLVLGRDITPDFAKTVTLSTDEAGPQITNLHWQDATSLVANIAIDADGPSGRLHHPRRELATNPCGFRAATSSKSRLYCSCI